MKRAKLSKIRAIDPVCIECGGMGQLVSGATIYPHRTDLHAKPFYLCACGAYVGCHPGTSTPLGKPAGAETRAAGWSKVSGARAHDRQCVPLCRFHHQLAPNACDKGQRQFWARLGIDDGVADLCRDLYGAFKGGQPGDWIVRSYAEDASRAKSSLPRQRILK